MLKPWRSKIGVRNIYLGTYALGQMVYEYALLVPLNQECSTSQARSVIYVIIKYVICVTATTVIFVTVHHLPKCISYQKATVVITGRKYYIHDFKCLNDNNKGC